MAKQQIFERKTDKLSEYLASLEELLKKKKGSALYEAFDVDPNAYKLSEDKVVDPSGLGQDVMNDDVKYTAYEPTSIAMTSPNTQVDPYNGFDTSSLDQQSQSGQVNFNSYDGLNQVVDEVSSIPVARTEDGGLLYSNGTVRYDDGTSRQATKQDVPQVVRQFSDGSVLLTNGLLINPNAGIGRGYSGLAGLSDLIFGKQQTVTQEYGNVNPIEPTPGNVNLGTDFRTKDLENRNLTLPFAAEVVGITYDDGTRFGDKSGHQGYGNSVYLKLPNGSVIHLSHLSDMENFQVGNIVRAYDYIGTPGTTGNTYGEHLDVEYYNPDGQIADPQSFWLDSTDYVDQDVINQSLEKGKESLSPEEKQWVEAQQSLIDRGVEMSLDPNSLKQEQPQNQNVGQTVQNVGQNLQEAVQPGSEQRQAVASGVQDLAKKAGIEGTYGVGATIAQGKGEEGQRSPAMQDIVSSLGRQEYNYNPYRQLAGNVLETVGDVAHNILPGAKIFQEGARSEAIAGGPTRHTGQALASEIGPETVQSVPGIGQNIKDIGSDLASRATQAINPIVAQAGEGLDALKDKVSNLFQKTPLMGLFQGQKQVGDSKGSTLIETGGQNTSSPVSDAFFKYGGADQYAQYLIDNAEQAKGGALDTSIFTSNFFEDPNRVANVFGKTYLGKEATNKYKEYLQNQIKEGYDEPYKTEKKQEGNTIYEYKIPITEYFQNEYFKNLLSETPEVLDSGFSWDQFQMPTVTKSASAYKGEVPTQSKANPIFSSAVVDLFKRAGTKVGQLAGDIFKTPAAVYQSSTPSMSYEVPQALQSIFSSPNLSSISIPSTQKTAVGQVSQPTLSDYLKKGKTVAQWYAETGQQSSLDKINKAKSYTSPKEIAELNKQVVNSVSPETAQKISQNLTSTAAQEKTQGGITLPTGAVATVSNPQTSQASAQLSGNINNSKSVFSSAVDWLKNLFKRS